MLEQIRNRTQTTFAKVILGIIIIPFALFGIDSYLSSVGSAIHIASVNDELITTQALQKAETDIRARQDESSDPKIFESIEFKKAVLDNLITTKLINQEINNSGFYISNSQVGTYIGGMPEFRKNGKFSQEQYDEILKINNLSPKKFDEKIKSDLGTQQVKDSLRKLSFIPKNKVQDLVDLAYQKRDVSIYELKQDKFKEKVDLSDLALKKVYEESKASFMRPDQVKIKFVIYSVAGIVPSVSVADKEVKEYFANNINRYQTNQQRRAKHILFTVGDNLSNDEVKNIASRAQNILNEIKKNPKNFEENAEKYSQDTESSKNGGDLGFFSRGDMDKVFEDTVFSMSKNQISELIKTEFGFHIVMLTDIKGEEVKFESVKNQIKGELIFNKALAEYGENAEDFSNTVYEQSDNLQKAANKFSLEIQDSEWLSFENAKKFFNNEAFAQAIFDEYAINKMKNIAAIEASPNNLVAARVVDFRPSASKPFEEVRESIKDFLVEAESQRLLIAAGTKLIEDVKSKSNAINWIDELTIDRIDRQGLSDSLINAIFKMDSYDLPSYTGLYDSKGEYVIVKLSKVVTEKVKEKDSIDTYYNEYISMIQEEIDFAFISDLKVKADIDIKLDNLN
ncbi:SurA N-terminal domain-containing protein [Methylophilaceae bacterium]|jgi:peptidyl-prolyl cis-trans isomerase D|nr:SurA N-terminal domain-containing protein [Methylophilaceae bacterium]